MCWIWLWMKNWHRIVRQLCESCVTNCNFLLFFLSIVHKDLLMMLSTKSSFNIFPLCVSFFFLSLSLCVRVLYRWKLNGCDHDFQLIDKIDWKPFKLVRLMWHVHHVYCVNIFDVKYCGANEERREKPTSFENYPFVGQLHSINYTYANRIQCICWMNSPCAFDSWVCCSFSYR